MSKTEVQQRLREQLILAQSIQERNTLLQPGNSPRQLAGVVIGDAQRDERSSLALAVAKLLARGKRPVRLRASRNEFLEVDERATEANSRIDGRKIALRSKSAPVELDRFFVEAEASMKIPEAIRRQLFQRMVAAFERQIEENAKELYCLPLVLRSPAPRELQRFGNARMVAFRDELRGVVVEGRGGHGWLLERMRICRKAVVHLGVERRISQ